MDFNTGYKILTYLSAFFVIVPLLVALSKWPYFHKDGKCLSIYLFVSLLTEIILSSLVFNGEENTVIVNYFSLAEFLLVVFVYYFVLKPERLSKLFYFSAVGAITLIFVFSDVSGPLNVFNGFYISMLILVALYYFYKETKEITVVSLSQHYFFWFNAAFLIYFGFAFFILLFEDFIVTADQYIARVLWTFHLALNIIYYSILTVGIWKHNGKQR